MATMPNSLSDGDKAIVRQIAIEAFDEVLPLFLLKYRDQCPAVKFCRRAKLWVVGMACGCLGLGLGIGYITARQVIEVMT